jgi:hypothetical protein
MALAGALGSTLVIACSDSTAPISARLPGRYELTTVLDSFRYASSCAPTNNGTICTRSTASAGPSKLYGAFTIGDTIPGSSTVLRFPVSDIVLHEADCALYATQCAESPHEWVSGVLEVKRDSLELYGVFSGGMQSGGIQIVLKGRFIENRFVGEISWYTYVFCCGSNSYSGSFVATRQP